MSKAETTIFSEATVTKNFKVNVGGVDINKDDVLDVEIVYNMFTPATKIHVIVRDTVGLYNMKKFTFSGDAKIKIMVTDILDSMYTITGRIVKSSTSTNARSTVLTFFAIDEASYLLGTTSKPDSCTTSVCEAVVKALDECGATAALSADRISVKMEQPKEPLGSSGRPFIVPGNRSRLMYFEEQLMYENAFMFRTHHGYHVGPVDLGKLDRIKDTYTTDTFNNYYLYKVHQYKIKTPKKVCIPKLRVIRYEGKEQKVDEISISNIASQLMLNGNKDAFMSVQESGDPQFDASAVDPNTRLNMLFRDMITTNQMAIWVIGNYKDNDVGKIVQTKISSDVYTNETQLQGNISVSGFWLVTSVTDKICGDKFVQKLVLSRFDNPKALN